VHPHTFTFLFLHSFPLYPHIYIFVFEIERERSAPHSKGPLIVPIYIHSCSVYIYSCSVLYSCVILCVEAALCDGFSWFSLVN
jgi:hypothetical protein